MHLVYPVLQVVKLLLQLSPGWLNSTKSKMNKPFQVNRRDFLKTGAFIGGGLLISFAIPTVIKRLASTTLAESPVAMNAFLRIGEDDSIYIILLKVEMGQGIWTTFPMLIAEELDCDLYQIKVGEPPTRK